MVRKNMAPRITASTHWPVIKLENTLWLREQIRTVSSAPRFGRMA